MNILIINQYGLPAGAPGITRHGDLGAALVRRRHSVSVIASGFDYLTRSVDRTAGKQSIRETHSGVDFFWLKTTAYTKNDGKRVKSMVEYSWKAFWKGLRLRRHQKPDVIFASSPHLLAGLTGLALAIFHRVPLVLEVRDLWPSSLVDLGAVKEQSRTYKVLAALEKLLYRYATRIIGVPPLAYKRIEEIGISAKKVVHIPNGIVLPENVPGERESLPQSLQEIIDAESSRQIFMYTGAHGVANNLGNVIDAMDYLREHNPTSYEKLAILFIGGGQQRESLIEIAHKRGHQHIHFHPQIDKRHLKQVLTYADALLFHLADANVFKYGVSPNKLYDYLEAAKPILFSCTDTDNIIEQLNAGVTFYPNQPASLADAMNRLLGDSVLEQQAMGKRGREYVLANHDWNHLAEQVEDLLVEVV